MPFSDRILIVSLIYCERPSTENYDCIRACNRLFKSVSSIPMMTKDLFEDVAPLPSSTCEFFSPSSAAMTFANALFAFPFSGA